MTRLWREGLPIQVQRASALFGQPAKIRVDGRTLAIDRVWQSWRIDADWWEDQGAVSREFYTVTTKDPPMLLVLYQDNLADGKWFISKLYD